MQMLFNITLFEILVVGIIANITTDIYELMLERVLGKMRDWHLVGRWMARIPSGTFILDRNDKAPPESGELLLGWGFHYIVGILFATIYLMGVHTILGQHPTFLSAVGFGVISVLAPWVILMPGLGVGVFATKAERPNFVRLMSLSVHIVFGMGLYLRATIAGLTR